MCETAEVSVGKTQVIKEAEEEDNALQLEEDIMPLPLMQPIIPRRDQAS